jgi:putative oxidoreductase
MDELPPGDEREGIVMLDRVRSLLRRVEWSTPLAIRVVLGITLITTGWGKLTAIDQVTGFFESLGIPAAAVQARVVSLIEFAGGIAILAGAGTRIAAALLAGVMAVAIATAIAPRADSVVGLVGSIEVIYLACFLHLAVHGAGAVSIDHGITRLKTKKDSNDEDEWNHDRAGRRLAVRRGV